MPAYEIVTYKRVTGDPLRSTDVAVFQSADNETATEEAYRRTRGIEADHVAVQLDADRDQLGSFEAAE